MILLPSVGWFRYNANEISKQFRETCLVVVVVFLPCHKLALGQGWYYWRNWISYEASTMTIKPSSCWMLGTLFVYQKRFNYGILGRQAHFFHCSTVWSKRHSGKLQTERWGSEVRDDNTNNTKQTLFELRYLLGSDLWRYTQHFTSVKAANFKRWSELLKVVTVNIQSSEM